MVRIWALSDSILEAMEKPSRDGRANKCNMLQLQSGSLESTNLIEPLYPLMFVQLDLECGGYPVKLQGAGEFILNKLSSLLHLSPSPSQSDV